METEVIKEKSKFTIQYTLMIKGVAVLLMLIHHLFYDEILISKCLMIFPYENIVLLGFARLSKVCVAVFVLLSGYGLFCSYSKHVSIGGGRLKFVFNHITSLQKKYVIVILPFLLFGIITGLRSLTEVYGSSFTYLKLLTDLFGFNYILFGANYLYNVTCWYIGMAIMLYIIFPFLYLLLDKSVFLLCGSCIVISFLPIISTRIGIGYISAFAIGMMCSKYKLFDYLCNYQKSIYDFILFVIVLLASLFRMKIGVNFDGIYATVIVAYLIRAYNYSKTVSNVFVFVGKYSATIFMMHTFVKTYFFQQYTYFLRIPVLVLLTLLTTCLVYAVLFDNLCFKIKTIFSLRQKGIHNKMYEK